MTDLPASAGSEPLSELIGARRVDFGRRSADYARHRPGLPRELYDRLGALLLREQQQQKQKQL